MKPRTTLMLAAILIVLAGIAGLFQHSRNQSLSAEGKAVFPAFAADKADGIDINLPNRAVKLRKQGTKWMVATEGGHEADQKLVQQILDGMGKFTTTCLISTTASKQAEFGVDSTGIRVGLMQGGKTVASFMVGKPGPDYQSAYVRPEKDSKVYLLPVYLSSIVNRGDQTWRRTTLLDLQPTDISSLTTKNAKETVTVEKEPAGTWKITAPFSAPAKMDVLNFAINSLTKLRASGFADSTLTPEAAGLTADTASVVVHTADGSTHTFTIGVTGNQNQSYTRMDDDPTIYLVPRGRWNTIFRPSASLRAEEPKAAGS